MSTVAAVLDGGGFAAFARALRASPFQELLDSGEAYTIFAPTDAAFAKFPGIVRDQMARGDATLLRAVVGYHFAAGKVMTARFAGKRVRAVMYGGERLIVDGRSGLKVNAANVVKPDMLAGVCVIHGIDAVLWSKGSAAAAL